MLCLQRFGSQPKDLEGLILGGEIQARGDISLLTRGHPGTKVWGASGAPELQAQVEAIECDELS